MGVSNLFGALALDSTLQTARGYLATLAGAITGTADH